VTFSSGRWWRAKLGDLRVRGRVDVRVDAGPPAQSGTHRDRRLSRRQDAFGTSITDFARRYADQNERDYQAFVKTIRSRRPQGA
jgi:hypothetical protein